MMFLQTMTAYVLTCNRLKFCKPTLTALRRNTFQTVL